MTWVDLVLVALVLTMAYGGFRRGLARELLDLAFLGLGSAAALHWFGPLGSKLHVLLQIPGQTAHWMAFVLIFLVVAGIVLMLGWHLDQTQSEGVSFSPILTTSLGTILGVVKGLGLAWLVLVALHHLPVLGPADRVRMHEAPVVQAIQGLQPTFVNMIHAFTPVSVSTWLEPELDRHF